MEAARKLNIPNLEFHQPAESVRVYQHSERIPDGFPRPDDHIIIADYLIDLPVIAVDLSPDSEHYGRALGYCHGDYWIIADSLSEFAIRLETEQESAVYGKSPA